MLSIDDYFKRTFFKRLQVARQIILRKSPYILIPHKPRGMVVPRDRHYTIGPVKEIIDQGMENATRLIETLQPYIGEYQDLVESGRFEEGGGHFFRGDSSCAYAMVRHFQPNTIIEIGCGQSTRVIRAALDRQKQETGNAGTLTCIDPKPRKEIEGIADKITYKSVLDVDEEVFAPLKAGDVLFIDGSHYAFNGTDVTYLFLEILPRLPSGVIVHVHDIYLPYEYPYAFSIRWYNEQYLLAALILDQAKWEVQLPVHALVREGVLAEELDGGSFWFRKV